MLQVHVGAHALAFGVHFMSSWGLVMAAALLVIWQPVSGSSSMPEIISLLNGAKVADILSPKVFIAKAVGLMLSVSSGLVLGYVTLHGHTAIDPPLFPPFPLPKHLPRPPISNPALPRIVQLPRCTHATALLSYPIARSANRMLPHRPEGPTIYLGAMMGVQLILLIRRLTQTTRFGSTVWSLSSDREMQHMVVNGAATGIATAFRSPIGGVLFVLEEAISFFDSSLIWKTYIVCVLSYYMLEVNNIPAFMFCLIVELLR